MNQQATEKQVRYLESLRASRTPHVDAKAVADWAATAGRKAVSDKIDELKRMPQVAGPISSRVQWEQQAEPEDGIYIDRATNKIYKVYKMVHGSGRQGVKVLVPENGKGTFHYLGSAVKRLPKSAVRMSMDEAKAFGKIYGFCVRCGRTLTDEGSIEAGIGPICAGKWHKAPAITVPDQEAI